MKLESVLKVLDDAAVIDGGKEVMTEANENMFAGLKETVPCDKPLCAATREEWEADLRVGEIQWCEKEFPEGPEREGKLHTRGSKKGQWKLSHAPQGCLPNAYTSAKSIIGGAIEAGIPTLGKSKAELQKEIKKSKTGDDGTRMANLDKFASLVKHAKKIHDNGSSSERETMIDVVQKTFFD